MHADLHFESDPSPSHELVQTLGDGLNQHALQQIGSRGFRSAAIWLRNDRQSLLGGAQVLLNWHWLQICLVWIDPEIRRQGLGTELLRRVETLGRSNGCTQAHLDTFSFQARGFYERHGYRLFGQLDDYPAGHSRYYLRKEL